MSSNHEQPESSIDLLIDRFADAEEARFVGDDEWAKRSLVGLSRKDHDKLSELLQCVELLAASGRPTSSKTAPPSSDETVTASTSQRSDGKHEQLVFGYAGYQIKELLGSGGFGVVYKAWNERLNRAVAIKIPRPSVIASEPDCRRFELEARAAAALQHANIVRVHDTFTDPQPAIVYEYCDGGTLVEFMKALPETPDETLLIDIAICLASALRHAHGRGILHRDVKPGNVLLCHATSDDRRDGFQFDGKWWVPKLCDFGLAKIMHEASDVTQTEMLLGTVNFMAPEQAAGDAKNSGTYTDIFAFGSVIYWLLTSEPPFKSSSHIKTLSRIENEDPVPLRQLRPEVSKSLANVCYKCLQKSPADRYETAALLVDDLLAIRRGDPISIKPTGKAERLQQWIRRNRKLAIPLMAVLLITAAGLVLQWFNNQSLSQLISELDQSNQKLEQRIVAEQNARNEVEASRQTLHQLHYAADIQIAAGMVEENRLFDARRRLLQHVSSDDSVDLRDFSWWYLYGSTFPPKHILTEHQHEILSLASAKTKRLLATGDKNGTIYVRSADDGTVVKAVDKFPGEVCDLVFSPDETLLVACGSLGVIRIYDTTGWSETKQLQHGLMTVKAVVFTPDGGTMITGSRDHQIVFWNTRTWKQERRFTAHDTVQDVSISQDGSFIVSGGDDGYTRVWSIESGEKVSEFRRHKTAVLATALTTDGRFCASGGYDNLIVVWDRIHDKAQVEIPTEASTWSLKFLPDSMLLVASSTSGQLTTYDVSDPGKSRIVKVLQPHAEKIRGFEILGDTRSIATVSDDRTLRLIPGSVQGVEVRRSTVESNRLAIRSDGSQLACGGKSTLEVRDRSGHLQGTIESPRNLVARLAYDPNGNLVVGRIAGAKVQLARYPSLIAPITLDLTPPGPATNIFFSPDTELTATITDQGELQVWKTNDGSLVSKAAISQGQVRAICFRPNGSVIVGTDDGKVLEVDLQNGHRHVLFEVPPSVYELRIDPTGQYLAAAGYSGRVVLWDLHTNKQANRFVASTSVFAMCFSPDSRLLAIGTDDVQLVHLATGQRLMTFGEINSPYRHLYERLIFTDSGDRLLAIHADMPARKPALRIWDTSALREKNPGSEESLVNSNSEID